MPYFRTHNRRQEQETKERLETIHQYFQDNPGCTIREAVTFMPETDSMVQKYSKNRGDYQDV